MAMVAAGACTGVITLRAISTTRVALPSAFVSPGVSAIPPTPGLAQPVQTGTIASTTSAAGTPPQQGSGALKYTKLWEGYQSTFAPQKLAADWPSTMEIVRLVSRDYMNINEGPENIELLVFRPLSQHGFLAQLREKKQCAVVQLPSQILLLAGTDKPSRLLGMLIPGGMDVVNDLKLTSTLQPMGAMGQTLN